MRLCTSLAEVHAQSRLTEVDPLDFMNTSLGVAEERPFRIQTFLMRVSSMYY